VNGMIKRHTGADKVGMDSGVDAKKARADVDDCCWGSGVVDADLVGFVAIKPASVI
jgi:hypothetical protein